MKIENAVRNMPEEIQAEVRNVGDEVNVLYKETPIDFFASFFYSEGETFTWLVRAEPESEKLQLVDYGERCKESQSGMIPRFTLAISLQQGDIVATLGYHRGYYLMMETIV
jgi:hypothetical protein